MFNLQKLALCTITKCRPSYAYHRQHVRFDNKWKDVCFKIVANPGVDLSYDKLAWCDMDFIYEHVASKHIENCPNRIFFKTMTVESLINNPHAAAFTLSYRNIAANCSRPLVTFENDFWTTNVPNGIAAIIIDGWPDDETKPGAAICKILLTEQGDFQIEIYNPDYINNPTVQRLIKESKDDLLERFGSACQPTQL